MNTAARLQTAAPPGAVVIGELTHDLCSSGVVFERMDPVHAKGKAEPVAAWRALSAGSPPRARPPEPARGGAVPFVGRAEDLERVCGLCEASATLRRLHSAIVVGEPGIGKSRLVDEALTELGARDDTLRRRVAGCLPYGESSPLAALAQLVRSLAGVGDDDDTPTVERKLDTLLPGGGEDAWLRSRTRALVGLPAPRASSPAVALIWREVAPRPCLAAVEPQACARFAVLPLGSQSEEY